MRSIGSLWRLRGARSAAIGGIRQAVSKAHRRCVDSVIVYPDRHGGVSVDIRGKLDALGARGFGSLGVANGGS